MTCPSIAILGQNLTFYLQAVDTSNVPIDCDALPSYKIYEAATDTEILSGTMAKLADAATTGFYAATVAITSANGFELWKSYAVRIAFEIAAVAVAKVYSFLISSSAVEVTATTGALTTLANYKTYAGITSSDYDTLISSLIVRATSAMESYCDRIFNSTSYRELYDGDGTATLYLKQYPVSAIKMLTSDPTDIIKVTNTNASAYNAYISIDVTYLTLVYQTKTGASSSSIALADKDLTDLIAAIIAADDGWSAEVTIATYADWAAAELLPCAGLQCKDTYAYLRAPLEPETDFDFDENTGMIRLPIGFSEGKRNIVVSYTAGYSTIPADLEQICIDLVTVYYKGRTADPTLRAESLGDHSIAYADGGGGTRDIPGHIVKRLAPYKRFGVAL